MLPRKLLILFLIILFTVLQSTLLNYIQIFRSKPDLLLILVIFFSLRFGRIYALGVGALCGVFVEATSALPSGAAFFSYSLGGLILAHFARWVYAQKVLGQMGIAFIFTFSIYLSLFFLFQIYNANLSLLNSLVFIILPACLYTALVCPALLRFLRLLESLIKGAISD